MKKLKLSLSICMMCLCLAVLCMGILAASSVSYQINGNISYNMIDGVARINTRVYKVAGDPASESDLQTAVTGTFLTTSSFAEIEANQSPIYAQTYQNKETLEYTGKPTTKDYDINVVYGANNDADAYYTYYVIIQIYNQTETSGYVLNASITNTDNTEITNTSSSYVATNTSVSNVAQNTFSNIVIGISAQTIEKAQTLTNSTESFAYKLSVTYDEVPLPTFDELLTTYTDANSNSYWGVPLGKISSDSETPIIWRYVGDYSTSSDGTETFTRYETYTSTKPTVDSGSVFVQETALGTFDYVYDGTDTLSIKDGKSQWSSAGNLDYFESDSLRTSIKDGGLFNLTTEEKRYMNEGYIQAVTIDEIPWTIFAYNVSTFSYVYTSKAAITNDGQMQDYFWLMSIQELRTYFESSTDTDSEPIGTTHDAFVWSPSGSVVSFYLRSPSFCLSKYGDKYTRVTFVGDDGSFGNKIPMASSGVRAAFRLA